MIFGGTDEPSQQAALSREQPGTDSSGWDQISILCGESVQDGELKFQIRRLCPGAAHATPRMG